MRILMLSTLWPPTVMGGAELYAAGLAERLEARGHEVGAVTRGVDGPGVVASLPTWPYALQTWRSQPRWRRGAFHLLDVGYDPATSRALRRVLARWRPDVVHSHSMPGFSGTGLRLPARLGLAHVHSLHDYALLCQRSSLVKRSGEWCTTPCFGCRAFSGVRHVQARGAFPQVTIAISTTVAKEHERFRAVAARMRIVRYPRPQVEPREPRQRHGPTVFGYIGQLAVMKGVQTLLTAFGELPAGRARLVVAGRGPLEGAVSARADAGVEYAGWVEGAAKEAFFAKLDCLVVPSQWPEPSGLVVNEALARGIPVIGARAGGIPEVVPPEWHPFLFHPGDPGDLARALRDFLAMPPAAAPPVRPTGPDWDAHLDMVLRAYRDAATLAGERRGATGEVRGAHR